MTARAIIKQSELRRYASIANEQNVSIEIDTPSGKIRVTPNIPVIHNASTVDDDTKPELTSLQAWRERNGRKDDRHPHSQKTTG